MKGVIVALIVTAVLWGCQRPPSGEVVARVNQAVLTKQDFLEAIPQDLAGISASGKEEMLKQWINGELFYQEAKKQGLHRDPKIARQLKEIQRDFLANQFIMREIYEKNTVSEEEARAYFDKHQAEYQAEIRFSRIQVATKEEAEKVKERLDKGEDFAKLAKEMSGDSLTRARGGDLPAYFRRGSGYIPLDFEEAIFSLKPGEVSQPIRYPEGYLIVKVTERRATPDKCRFEDIKEGLISVLSMDKKRKAYEQLMEELRAKAKVESHPELLK